MTEDVSAALKTNQHFVRLDSRGRVNLQPFSPTSDTYILTRQDNGTFLLEAAVIMTATDFAQWQAQRTPAPTAPAADTDTPADVTGLDERSEPGA